MINIGWINKNLKNFFKREHLSYKENIKILDIAEK
jgi:hypothetical protein